MSAPPTSPDDPTDTLGTGPDARRAADRGCLPESRGRGARQNPPNRFARDHRAADVAALAEDALRRAALLDPPAADANRSAASSPQASTGGAAARKGAAPRRQTEVYRDPTRSILSRNDSPDIPFSVSLNPYRGCEHGCAYCYARPTHEYLGFSAGLDFETRIIAKTQAPELLDRELMQRSWQPQGIALSGVTDPYQPCESDLQITRGCLEVLATFRNPVGIITKSDRILRDLDLLGELASHGAAAAAISITTLDADLARRLEPQAASPRRRLEAIRMLAEHDIPVAVMVAPVIPGLTDAEIPAILRAARDAGATRAGSVLLRLPHAVSEIFDHWLAIHRPLRRERVLSLLRSSRGGKLNESAFGSRMRGEGPIARHIRDLVRTQARRLGYEARPAPLSAAAFRRPRRGQLSLFDPGA